jgi:hypothetical protein
MTRPQITDYKRSESGQVMVFLAICFVAILGFSALAIDGGMVFADRRHAQNAADAASLAGGSGAAYYMRENNVNYNAFICGTKDASLTRDAAELAAINNAVFNDYILDADISDDHGVVVNCEITDMGSHEDKHLDVITRITRDTSTSFAHLIFPGPLRNQVEAVVRIYPPAPLAFGKAIIALNEDACSGNQNGVIFSGSSITDVKGGGVWSNGCLTGNGTNFSVSVTSGGVGYAGSSTGTLTNISPAPEYIPSPIPHYSTEVNEPSCSGLPNRTVPKSGDAILEPGIYDEIHWTGGALSLNPGLYCISSNKGLDIQGGSLTGIGVTIYLQTGGATINGNVTPVDLRAPVESPDPAPAVPGILMYMAHGNTSTISITGNSTSFYLGTIYGPDGDLYISGTSSTNPTFNTQLIGYNVEVSGGALIDINFNDDDNFEQPPYLDLLQ